ncbi:MAG: hypothetical protein FWG71_05100 [Synergistaceae bacterium]|nr:hypothetical protein [Synergistaceae bacterium]
MVFEKYVTIMMRKKRRAYALVSTVGLIFFLTVLLGVAISHADYSFVVMEAYSSRFQARNALESMTNLALKWLSAEVKSGIRPRAATLEYLTDFDSLRIFTSFDFNGCEVRIYDLDYAAEKIAKPVAVSRIFPPSFPGGYMIRAVAEKKGLAPLMQESVYVVTLSTIPGGGAVEVLDESPVYSRELFRK